MDKRQLRHTFIFTDQERKNICETLLLKAAEEDNKIVSEEIEFAIIDYLANRFPDLRAAHRLQELQEDKETPQT